MKKVFNILVDIFIFILFFLIVVSFYIVGTSQEGKASPIFMYRVFVNRVNNMAPAIEDGDMVVGKIVDPSTLKENDIIIYYDESLKASYATRIKEVINDNNELKFKCNSDNIENEQTVSAKSIDGKVVRRVHVVGLILAFLTTTRGTVILILGIVLLIVIGFILSLLRDDKLKNKKDKKEVEE